MALLGLLLLLIAAIGGGLVGYRYYQSRTAAAPVETAAAPVPDNTPPKPAPTGTPAETAPADTSATPAAPAETPATAPTKPVPAKPKTQTATTKPPATQGGTPSLPMAPTTPTQTAETPAPAPRRDTPPPTPAPSGYHGPTNGLLLWSGQLPKNDSVVIDGGTTTVGSVLSGSLPGVPINITIEPKDITVAEAPSAGNGWKRFAFHAKKGRKTVVTIYWTVAP